MTEGRAGQAIAVSGVFAVLASFGISSATRGVDRRAVLLGLTLLMMVSGVMVALAPNAGVFMAGRALVGIVVGGFWALSAATVMRLVAERDVPRALGVLNGGNALATTVATCTEAALRRLWRSLCTARSSAGRSTSAKSSTRPPRGRPGPGPDRRW